MAYINKYDTGGKCSKVGHKAESDFASLAESKGWAVSKASRRDNMYKHIDFILRDMDNLNSDHYLVDVKSRKKTSRKDKNFNDDWIWLEFKNVQGKDGWLLGASTHIVFERENEFVLVPREELLSWARQAISDHNGGKVTIKCRAKNAREAKYKYYTRWNRDDLLTQVNYKDMIQGIKNIEIWAK
tara:strand:+ start:1178 stop:1732 length:555 start_codon:yes stop_codon:yes gene_type:complete